MQRVPLIAVLTVAGAFAFALPAAAQDEAPPSGECTQDSDDEACGTPDQSGGGCGCGGGSILIANTDEGDSYQYADDYDDDGREDNTDNCPFAANADQSDGDAEVTDGVHERHGWRCLGRPRQDETL